MKGKEFVCPHSSATLDLRALLWFSLRACIDDEASGWRHARTRKVSERAVSAWALTVTEVEHAWRPKLLKTELK